MLPYTVQTVGPGPPPIAQMSLLPSFAWHRISDPDLLSTTNQLGPQLPKCASSRTKQLEGFAVPSTLAWAFPVLSRPGPRRSEKSQEKEAEFGELRQTPAHCYANTIRFLLQPRSSRAFHWPRFSPLYIMGDGKNGNSKTSAARSFPPFKRICGTVKKSTNTRS